MASTQQQIESALTTSMATLYTAFVGGATRASLVSLDLCNTTIADIMVDIVMERADATQRFLIDDGVVPAKGTLSYRGMVTMDASSEKIRGRASATGVDVNGTVVENA